MEWVQPIMREINMVRPPPIITEGIRYGSLVTTGGYIARTKTCKSKLECKCDCGTVGYKTYTHLKTGDIRSCGVNCPYYPKPIEHGHARRGKRTKEHACWKDMKARCDNIKNKDYPTHGGAGIIYSQEFETFIGFIEYMGISPSKYHRFERIDKQGDFEPGNVHWYLASGKKKKK